jgi:hypothetical protein
LPYAGGSEFAVYNIGVYSSDRPHVIIEGQQKFSPWVDRNDLRRRGAVLVWETSKGEPPLEAWRAAFGTVDVQPTLVLARQTHYPVKPVRIGYAFVPPQP